MLKNGISHTNNHFHKIWGGALVESLGTILGPIWALPGCILKKTPRLTWKFFHVNFFRKNSSNYWMNHGFNSRNSMGPTPWYNKVGWGAYTKNNKFCSFGTIEIFNWESCLRISGIHVENAVSLQSWLNFIYFLHKKLRVDIRNEKNATVNITSKK